MDTLIKGQGLTKRFGRKQVLDGIDLEIKRGQIVGLVGVNGAGKSTLLGAILGLLPVDGDLQVLGQDPLHHRAKLLERVTYISDVASLPRWAKVSQLLKYMAATHPRFSAERCRAILAGTDIPLDAKVKQLSKGMVTQLHLALITAIDAELLVLDEPTLGLDVVYRKGFYQRLLEDYFDHQKTILITTHEVEEVEHLLTHVLFLHGGKLVLDSPVEELAQRFCELEVGKAELEAARALGPLAERSTLGGHLLTFERPADELAGLGRVGSPSLADLFVAKAGRAA
ncbi:ABC transporter ATP-binding protein [Gallaecimonas kandeliae]|uniref:ABC transporter ATP-binding protein n=1 Tax=Gallaecimonas kandeliae TaxID=3029055 RepID=UPI00264A2531|nr:ABC transporter ATP-binding protein [Gallaecimonas kandeliae]WKE67205.1 ABC transporter ATP-binding protein [Gallaecimonas kandeliae]